MFAKRAHVAHDFELNLTPIIDCFVTLICFLLLSTTYVNLVGMNAKVPISVPASATAQQVKDDPKFKLELLVKANAVELLASSAGSASGKRSIANVAGKPDFVGLHAALIKIKNEKPNEFAIYFSSQVDMEYEQLVRFMDTTRNIDAKDGVFAFTDERNGKTVRVDTLFPDFVIANLAATVGM